MLTRGASPALDATTILDRARAAAPVLRDEAAKGEALRRLTDRAVDALRGTGVFSMPMPRSRGGPEVDIGMQIEILEELAAADGSAGWCAMIGSDGGYYGAALDDDAARRVFPLDGVTAGWVVPAGRLDTVDGGFRLSGQWQFGSGCTHADTLVGGAVVMRDGRPVTTTDGRQETRVAVLPADRFEILDTWHTTGLRASGSHDYRIDDAFVPTDQTFRLRDLGQGEAPLYAWPGMFFANLAAVPLGIARAALDEANAALEDKILMPEMQPAREDGLVGSTLAEAYTAVAAARSLTLSTLDELWETLASGARPGVPLRATLATLPGYTVRTCRDAVRAVAEVVGTAAIRSGGPLERHARDLTTMGMHVVAQPRLREVAGAIRLGATETLASHPLVAEGLL
jgi:alkylation response protein AidB-like acyl-CoA dehydrogenase